MGHVATIRVESFKQFMALATLTNLLRKMTICSGVLIPPMKWQVRENSHEKAYDSNALQMNIKSQEADNRAILLL